MSKATKFIVITKMPLTVPLKEAFACAVKDKTLVESICEYRKQIEREGKEVFKRQDNVLVCEDGYYFAFYEEDLRNAEGGIDNPVPFKGKDGRSKVDIVKENGEKVAADLADLVAMRFVPNPNGYKRTYFYDANPENCNGANLFWRSNLKYWFLKTFKIKTKSKFHEENNYIQPS